MARNGSGTFALYTPGNPVVTGSVISSVWANQTLQDIGTALTQSLAYDGQTNPVANLPMATYRHTGVGNAAALTDYTSATDVQRGTPTYLTSVSGTDTILATAPYTMAAYTAGQTFRFIAVGANTGPVTLNVNAIGAISITKLGANALVAGDITSGQAVEVILDGTRAQMIAPTINALPYTQTFTASGTFTMPAGYRGLLVECIGGGGGGGSGRRGASLSSRLGGWAGGGGARTRAFITTVAAGSAIVVTVGAGGTGGAAQTSNTMDGNAGTDGGNSSFGAYLVAYGGEKGSGGISATDGASAIFSSGGGGSGGKGVLGVGGFPSNISVGAMEQTTGDKSYNTGGGGAGGSDRYAPGCAEWGGGAGGGSLVAATAYAGGGAIYGGCGGGGGGGIDAADVNRAGGAGGTNAYAIGGGAAAGVAGTAGTGALAGGGGGGGTGVAGAGVAGGAGGAVGGGGGGGSASLNGNASGAGGAGGRGEVRVWGIL